MQPQRPGPGPKARAPRRGPPSRRQNTVQDRRREGSSPTAASKGPLIWRTGRGCTEALALAFADGIEVALHLSQNSSEDPGDSLHRFRKTIRRLKALTRLGQPLIDDDAARSVLGQLTLAMGQTSTLRDERVLPEALAAIPERKKSQQAQRDLSYIFQRRLAEIARAHLEENALAVAGLPLGPLSGRFASALPEPVAQEDLAVAFGASHRRLRRAARKALATDEPRKIHRLRRRVKEMRYQTELLLPITIAETSTFLTALTKVATALGEITDLFILEDALNSHRKELVKGPAKRLLKTLRKRWRQRWHRLEDPLETLLDHRPKRVSAFIWPPRD